MRVLAFCVGVVASTCSTCGTITVSHAGTILGRVNLATATTRTAGCSGNLQTRNRTGTGQLESSNAEQVLIDGILIAH